MKNPRRATRWTTEWLWIGLLGLLMLLGFWWIPGRSGTRSDTYSAAHDGKKAFLEIIRTVGTDEWTDWSVRRNKELLATALEDINTLLLLGPARLPSPREWETLEQWVDDGGRLVFAPRHDDATVDMGPFDVTIRPVARITANGVVLEPGDEDPDDEDAEAIIEDFTQGTDGEDDVWDLRGALAGMTIRTDKPTTDLAKGNFRWLSRSYLKDYPDYARVILEARGVPQVLSMEVGYGRVVVAATDTIFANREMARRSRDNWLLAYRIFEAVDPVTEIAFDESLNESGTPKVFGVLFNPFLRRFTLQLLLLAAIFCWWKSRRFGPADPPSEPPRRSVREHAIALGNLHFKAGTGVQAVDHYLEFFQRELGLEHYAVRRSDEPAKSGKSGEASEASEASQASQASKARAREHDEARRQQAAAMLARWANMNVDAVREALDRAEAATRKSHISSGETAALVRSLAKIKERLQHAKGTAYGA